MCGIAGILDRTGHGPPTSAELQAMADAMIHRGPDGEGQFVSPDGRCGLAVRRLAIVDPPGGAQPFLHTQGGRTLALVGNGEIYNHLELRAQLEAKGCVFHSRSDIEVILHGYLAWGTEVVDRLNGQFAVALWDGRDGSLFLARDRLGIRPLFYAEVEGRLLFASEIRALRAAGLCPQPDPRGVVQVFWLGDSTARTLFKGVSALPAAQWVHHHPGDRTTTRRYWDVEIPPADAFEVDRSRQEWAAALRERLSASVRRRLMADVPVGVYLSGGLDSSAVTALVSGHGTELPAVYSVGFSDPEFDERAWSEAVARHLQLERTLTVLDLDDVRRGLPQLIAATEGVHLWSGGTALLALSRQASGHIKVALTGEGSDELFGGYSDLVRLYLHSRRPGLAAARHQPEGIYARAIQAFGCVPATLLHAGQRSTLLAGVYGPRLKEACREWHPFDDLAFDPDRVRGRDRHSQSLYFLLRTRLSGVLLPVGDRAGMAHSLETRYPFLDHELVELAATMPPAVKGVGLRTKTVLRAAMAGLLPRPVLARLKQPLATPGTEALFRRRPPDYVAELLSPEALQQKGYFSPEGVGQLRERVANRYAGASHTEQVVLAAVLGVQLWDEIHLKGRQID